MKRPPRAPVLVMTSLLVLPLAALSCRSAQPQPLSPSTDFAESRRLAREAYGRQDYAGAAQHFREALRIAPAHPSLLYNLAAMETLLGKHDDAIGILEQLAGLDLYLGVASEDAFTPLREDPRFQEIVGRLAKNREATHVTSSVLIRFTGRGLIPEGLAFDETTGRFFVSSVRERKILRVTPEGRTSEFAGSNSGLLSAMGMRADSDRRVLWVATSAAPQMERFEPSDRGAAMILKFDFDSGQLLKKYAPDLPHAESPEGGVAGPSEHWFGDLTLAPDGTVYVTDSTQPEIYRITPSEDRLELLIRDGRFQSLQGIDLSRDGQKLFVADYSTGLYRIDLGTGLVTHLASPPSPSLIGIDGLYRCGDDLLAVQNGITPNRLLRITLVPRADQVLRVHVIDRNHPQYNEPTLGVVTGDRFAYIANSQWGAVDKDNQLIDADKLEDPVILGLELSCR
ncbi:MAG TPA: tetratricopeptide repeat protein [Thermoanaerobaculia bacterium]|nr:tetratricopeptide repeat protein [Thermoanaerobaculia bacterium]